MFGLQPIHIALLVIVAVLVFGPKKLPEFGRGLGKGIREFRHASGGGDGKDANLVEAKDVDNQAESGDEVSHGTPPDAEVAR